MKLARLALIFWLASLLNARATLITPPFASPGANSTSLNLAVSGSTKWVDTGMDVQPGDKLHITAKGMVTMGNNTGVTAEGAARGWVDTLRALMVPGAGRGALVGRVGNSDAATPFFIGANGTVLAPVAGRLYLGINTDSLQTPDGSFQVHIDRMSSSVATAGVPPLVRATMTFSHCLRNSMPSCLIGSATGHKQVTLETWSTSSSSVPRTRWPMR
jgi:hypothetical protein